MNEEKHSWDEYLLSVLSLPTAKWLVKQCEPSISQKNKLQLIVQQRLDVLPPMLLNLENEGNEKQARLTSNEKGKIWQPPEAKYEYFFTEVCCKFSF